MKTRKWERKTSNRKQFIG